MWTSASLDDRLAGNATTSHPRLSLPRSAALILLSVLALTACSAEETTSNPVESPPGSAPGTGSGQAGATPHDPPRKFQVVGQQQPLEDELLDDFDVDASSRIVASGPTITSVDENGARVFDVVSGKQSELIPPTATRPGSSAPEEEVETVSSGYATPAKLDGKDFVLVAYRQSVKGFGTAKDYPQTRLQAIDPAAGEVAWVVDVDMSRTAGAGFGPGGIEDIFVDERSGLVAVDAGSVMLQDSAYYADVTLVVDATAKKTAWQKRSMQAVGLLDGVVVGIEKPQESDPDMMAALVGVGARDESRRWRILSGERRWDSVTSTGNHVYLVSEQYSSGGDEKLSIVDAAGKEHAATPAGPLDDCFDDQRSVLVCASDDQGSSEPTDEIIAFDTDSGKKLWGYGEKLGNRVVPKIRAVFHGLIYGETQNGPVVMNARTGQDEPDKLEHLPWAVSKYAAATVTEGSFTDPNGDTKDQNAIIYLSTTG